MKKLFAILMMAFIVASCGAPAPAELIDDSNPPIPRYNNVTLEVSLKPFKKNDKEYIKAVCRKMFSQWETLLSHADTVSVLMWTSDGSEILEYTGDLDQKLEWCKFIGNPNTPAEINSGPREINLHERAYTYMPPESLPEFTYRDLRFIIKTIKEEGSRITSKVIRVGETFDPGPEFAKSDFKYTRHPEICMANTMGTKSFVCCYATLDEDSKAYAAYPAGIPQGTPLGEFLGRQSNELLRDMGYDYIWLSNGFGFGMETWNTVGAIYDGETFNASKMRDIQAKILNFWTEFRKGCPDFRIETRGTNLSAGIDLARDGVDIRSIYNGGFNLLPPPNSPWAALNGDFGLELTGYMSRIAELPDDRYLYRFYTHDPWWANSPWLDRYGREAQDIYLAMAVSRVNEYGKIVLPSNINILTVDDSYGNMPDQVPSEVIPHLLQARRIAPDKAGPVVWVYPFDEYHDYAFNHPERLEEVFFGDWFIRQALNEGLPMNTVVSTGNFAKLIGSGSDVFNTSIVVTTVPDAGSDMERRLMEFVSGGGQAIIYGPAGNGSKAMRDFIGIVLASPLEGEFAMTISGRFDKSGSPMKLRHTASLSGSGIETVASDSRAIASVSLKGQRRDIVTEKARPDWRGGKICYVRGTNSASYTGGMLLSNDDASKWFRGGSLMRYALGTEGYSIIYNKLAPSSASPVNCILRHNNGLYFAGYTPDQTVEQMFRLPQGAPVFVGSETELRGGYSTYRMPKSWSKECRVFVVQESGIVSCREMAPVEYRVKRKIGVDGLHGATVRIYPDSDLTNFKVMPHNNHHPEAEELLYTTRGTEFDGVYFELKNYTGQLVVTW